MSSIIELLKSDNWRKRLEAAYPGCDLSYWEARRPAILANAAKPKAKRRRSRRSSKRRRTLSTIIPFAYFEQETRRNQATTQLIERANDTQPATRTILITDNDHFQVLEVS